MLYFFKKMMFLITLLLCLPPMITLATPTLTGAGSSFVYPLMSRWAADFKEQTGHEINYQSIGSGGGLSQLQQRTVDFAAVDMPQSSQVLAREHWIQFPLAIGGIVITVNIPHIERNCLKLNSSVLANIFLGKITRWNDPAIMALNPTLALPAMNILVIHRADGSGTTFNFTHYLSLVSPAWKKTVGSSTEVNWPTGIGGKGNTGVAMFTQRIPGSISYTEYSFAKLTNLSTVQLQNKAGVFVQPNFAHFQAALTHIDWDSTHDFNQLITNATGADSWPIMATTFALMPIKKSDDTKTALILKFIQWGYTNGIFAVKALDYVPLPPYLMQRIQYYWQQRLNVSSKG